MKRLFLLALPSAALFLAATGARANIIRAYDLRGAGNARLCVEVPDAQAARGQRLQLAGCHGDINQSFVYSPGSGTIKSSTGNACLDVSAGDAREGNRVQLWTCNQSSAQGFAYERAEGQFHFRADPSFCVTADESRAHFLLSSCKGDPRQRFALEVAFGDYRFDQVSWLTTHNAHVNSHDANWLIPNQDRSIDEQLHDGVRALMVDSYSFQGDVHLCHGDCNGLKGFAYAEPRQKLSDVLKTVTDYLNEEPDAIITVFLEDYASAADMKKVLEANDDVRRLLFDPYAQQVANGWPTLQKMVDSNKRLIIISDHSDKKDLGIGFGKDFTVENYWSLGLIGLDTQCRSRWDGIPLNTVYPRSEPLFVMNQFRDIPGYSAATSDNSPGKLLARLSGLCMPAASRRPNFVAVDFYEAGGLQGVRETLHILRRSKAEIWENKNFQGRVQLLEPGDYLARQLTFGSDVLSAFRLSPGTSISLFEDGAWTAPLAEESSSMPYVGDAWNDAVSSLKVREL